MNIRCVRWAVALACVGLWAGFGPVTPAAAQVRDDYYRSGTTRSYDGWYDANGQWHTGTYTGDTRNGWTDMSGRFHQGAPVRTGWYDASGQWHSGSYDTSRRDGWYDTTGRWHDGMYRDDNGAGWYDSNGQWRTGASANTTTRDGWYDADGRWHSGTSPNRDGWYDSSGRWHRGTEPANGWYDANGRWHPGGDRSSTSWRRDNSRDRWVNRNGRTGRSNVRSMRVPENTPIDVTINQPISSETAQVGDEWTGTVQRAVVVNGRIVVPAGTTVRGSITEVQPAENGSRAVLQLGMDAIDRAGRDMPLSASMEPIVAGSTRTRDVGAVAGGAAGGAILGGLLSHSKKGALLGGLLGGVAGGAYVKTSKGYEVRLKAPFTVQFVTDQTVAVDY